MQAELIEAVARRLDRAMRHPCIGERRQRLVAFVEASERMPAEAKSRILAQLGQPSVPADVVQRIEARIGG